MKDLEIIYLIVCTENLEEFAIILHFKFKDKKEKIFRKKGETGSDEFLLYDVAPSCKMEYIVVQKALKKQHITITLEKR